MLMGDLGSPSSSLLGHLSPIAFLLCASSCCRPREVDSGMYFGDRSECIAQDIHEACAEHHGALQGLVPGGSADSGRRNAVDLAPAHPRHWDHAAHYLGVCAVFLNMDPVIMFDHSGKEEVTQSTDGSILIRSAVPLLPSQRWFSPTAVS